MRPTVALVLLLTTGFILGCKPKPAPPPAPRTSSIAMPIQQDQVDPQS